MANFRVPCMMHELLNKELCNTLYAPQKIPHKWLVGGMHIMHKQPKPSTIHHWLVSRTRHVLVEQNVGRGCAACSFPLMHGTCLLCLQISQFIPHSVLIDL